MIFVCVAFLFDRGPGPKNLLRDIAPPPPKKKSLSMAGEVNIALGRFPWETFVMSCIVPPPFEHTFTYLLVYIFGGIQSNTGLPLPVTAPSWA